MSLVGEWLVKRAQNPDVERRHLNKILQEIATATSDEAIQDIVSSFLVAGTNITLTYNDVANTLTIAASGGGGSGNSVTTVVSFGGGVTYSDKASVVVTGQAWVTATSEIIAQVLTPAGVDPDEMYLLNFRTVISDLVPGVGFTVTVYTETWAVGDYDVMCIGV